MTIENSLIHEITEWFKATGASIAPSDPDDVLTGITYQDLLIYLGPSLASDDPDDLEIGAIVALNIPESSDIEQMSELLSKECSSGISVDVAASEGIDIWVTMQLAHDNSLSDIGESLQQFLDTSLRCRSLVEHTLNPVEIVEPDASKSAIDEIKALVGVDEIVRMAVELKATFEVLQRRRDAGLNTQFDIPHLVFTGNPGTGKTTVANKIGMLFKEIGLLPSGHLVEARRKDLIGQYIGQTAPKTEEVINRAIGGVLFIDEAYALNDNQRPANGGMSFGDECITTLLAQMENRKGEFVVIVAGYPEEMSNFLDSNPGLRSRFDQTWNFRDYTNEELLLIMRLRAQKEDYVISASCDQAILGIFDSMKRDKHFGNARTARNLLQGMKRKLAIRVVEKCLTDRESLMTLLPEDIEAPKTAGKQRQYGFAPRSIDKPGSK